MDNLRVKNWDKFQRYRKDRGAPPWIALHRKLQRDPEWMILTSEQRGWLVDIWMLAAERNGTFPADPAMIQRLCGMDSAPDLTVLKHFINQSSANVDGQRTDNGRTTDRAETETYTETEKERAGTRKPKKTGSRLPAGWKPDKKLLAWAMKERSDLDMQRVIDSFTDYWIAKTGSAATKLDWDATFRNWVRNEKPNRRPQAGNGKRETAVQARARRNRDALAAAG